MAESAEASELADDSIDRSDPEDGEEEVDEDGEDEEEDEDPEQESEEEEEVEEEELTGKARFEKRDSDSDTDSLPSVPDGSPLPSDYDSDAERAKIAELDDAGVLAVANKERRGLHVATPVFDGAN